MTVDFAKLGVVGSVLLLFCLSANGLYASPRVPALDQFPSKLLNDYYFCSTSLEHSVERYYAVKNWFESFNDPDIYQSVDNIRQLIYFEVLTNIIVLIKSSKDRALSEKCTRTMRSTLEAVYEQVHFAYEWIKAKEFVSETDTEIKEMEDKKGELNKRIEDAFEQYKELMDENELMR